MAAAVNADPIEFRLRHIKEPRDVAVIKAAADAAKWETRTSPRRDQSGNNVSGRGIAYAQRNGTRVAIVAEVDIDRSTGKIFARKFTVAHDCGQIINPDGLVKCIEGNIVQGVSRTLWEEVSSQAEACQRPRRARNRAIAATSKAPSRLTLEDLQAPFLGMFLDNLESARANGARSRNLRLAAITAILDRVSSSCSSSP